MLQGNCSYSLDKDDGGVEDMEDIRPFFILVDDIQIYVIRINK